MEYTIFGFKINIINVIIFMIIGFLIATMTVCSCSRVKSLGDAVNTIKGSISNGINKINN